MSTGTFGAVPAPGFADPTRDAQRAFRTLLDALAHPGSRYPLAGPETAPAALGPTLAAVLLTLLDEATPAHLAGDLGRATDAGPYLAFHTGAPLVGDPAEAAFVVAAPADLPPLAELALGTDEAPHRSATVVLDARGAAATGPRFEASGPGIETTQIVDAPWAPAGFAETWARNAELFPRGVDLLVVDTEAVTGVPRTTRLRPMGTPTTTKEA